MRTSALLIFGLVAAACGDGASSPGRADTGTEPRDTGGSLDGTAADVGPPLDAGADSDAEGQSDAGGFSDAGFNDAGFNDAGFSDAGFSDAGFSDAGFVDAGAPTDAGFGDDGGLGDAGTSTIGDRQPILFVHGINGSSAEFATMMNRLVQDGWPRTRLRAIDFPDPRWGCNLDNAAIVESEVNMLLLTTGAARVDLVAHSMGAMSTRYFLKNLGGTQKVSTYVTLGGMHHGQRSACLNPRPVCVWQEICPTHQYLTQLNAAPATPGPVHWVSIYSLTDGTVDPSSSHLDGAENIEVTGVDHSGTNGLTESLLVYPEVKRVLEYPSPP